MSGSGFKTFVDGDVLTAAEVNGYLMKQAVVYYATTAARDVDTPFEGKIVYLADSNKMQFYTGTAWIDMQDVQIFNNKGDLVAGTGADTRTRLSVGSNEQRLVADSGEAAGLKYVADTTNYAIGAKGDLLVGTAADTLVNLGVGSDGQVLTADSGETSGVKWAAAGGASLVFASDYVGTSEATTSTSYTDLATSGPAVTLTTGTKALVFLRAGLVNSSIGNASHMSFAVSGASTVSAADASDLSFRASGTNGQQIQDAGTAIYVSGLTAGSNTFTAKYRAANATATFLQREITVIDLGS